MVSALPSNRGGANPPNPANLRSFFRITKVVTRRAKRILRATEEATFFGAWREASTLEQWLVVDRRAIDDKALDGGTAGARHGGDDGDLALVARALDLA